MLHCMFMVMLTHYGQALKVKEQFSENRMFSADEGLENCHFKHLPFYLTGRERRCILHSWLWCPPGLRYGGRGSHRLRQQDLTAQHAITSLILWATEPWVRSLWLRRNYLHIWQERPEGSRVWRWCGAVPRLWVYVIIKQWKVVFFVTPVDVIIAADRNHTPS